MATIPIVGAAVVYDLRKPGQPRPDPSAGWAACEAATEADPPQGTAGVGAGCSAGKAAGRDWAVKGGQGWAVARHGDVTVGAIMGVNPLGDVLDEAGEVLAGTRAPAEAPRFPSATMEQVGSWGPKTLSANTVIGCVVTNGRLSKVGACRAADLAHSGIARSVKPAHTSVDGDILFLLATGQVEASVDLVADLAAEAVAAAVRNAVRHATAIDGLPVDPRARPAALQP
jgi:L-aminopeptidase/D-esterase-like protein